MIKRRKMPKRVTIKTIAQDLGISHMTVSRALSNSTKVREATRQVILRRADELGYVKSAAAAAMRGDRTTTVGLLLPNLTNEFYARFANTLATCLENADLQLIIHLTNDEPPKERRALLKLKEIQARGVVLVPTTGVGGLEGELFQGMQVIQLIRTAQMRVPSGAMLVNDRAAIIEAVHRLAAHRHKRIAYIGGSTTLSSGAARLNAFKAGLEAVGLSPAKDLLIAGEPSFEMGYRAVQTLVEQGGATALVCGGIELSNGALNGCLEKGIRIPEDLVFIGYGDPSYYQWIGGGISAIRLPVDDLAQQISSFIGRFGPEKECQQNQLVVQAELIFRQTRL